MTDTTDRSRRAQKTPLPPEVLADALHDRTHENSGRLLHASPLVVSTRAALLRDLDAAAAGVQRLDRLDAESAAKAIRALEAKVRELEADEDQDELDIQPPPSRTIKLVRKEKYEELRVDRDRLAGDVERLEAEASAQRNRVADLRAANLGFLVDNTRLTSELAAARGNEARLDYLHRKWARPSEGPRVGRRWHLSTAYFYGETFYEAIDAARRAGEGEE